VVTTAITSPRDGQADANLKALIDKYRDNEKKAREQAARDAEMAAAEKGKGELFIKGRAAYGQTCIACHASDGKGMPAPEHDGTTIAPPLAGSRKLLADKQLVARIVLHGLTGPNNGVTYPAQMASFKWATDEWLASILTYARNDWGNKGSAITPEDIAGVRQLESDRNRPFTLAELYQQVESTAPVTPDGAKVAAVAGEIVADPSTAELHGSGIRVDCYPSGLDIGFWNNWQDWVSWKIQSVPAGDYNVTVRTTNPDEPHKPHVFLISVDGRQLTAAAPVTTAWEQYCDVPVGTVHIDHAGEISVEFHPRDEAGWGPTNLSAVKLIPAK
jgi:mono/diheme cytochrome c family protein